MNRTIAAIVIIGVASFCHNAEAGPFRNRRNNCCKVAKCAPVKTAVAGSVAVVGHSVGVVTSAVGNMVENVGERHLERVENRVESRAERRSPCQNGVCPLN